MNWILGALGIAFVLAGVAFLRRIDERREREYREREACDRRAVLEAAQTRLAEHMRVHGVSLLTGRRYRPSHQHMAPPKRTSLAPVSILRARKP